MKKVMMIFAGVAVWAGVVCAQNFLEPPQGTTVTLTNSGIWQVLLTNWSGVMPGVVVFQNVGPGPAVVRWGATNGTTQGLYLDVGQAVTFGAQSTSVSNWFGRSAGTTNTTIWSTRAARK